MMTKSDKPLVKYEQACRAIAEAKSADELTRIRDEASALRACARIAKNRQLEIDACEIRARAERRLGQMLGEHKNERAKRGRPAKGLGAKPLPTLEEIGVDKNLLHRARNLSKLSDPQFEKAIREYRKDLEDGSDPIAMFAIPEPSKPKPSSKPKSKPNHAEAEDAETVDDDSDAATLGEELIEEIIEEIDDPEAKAIRLHEDFMNRAATAFLYAYYAEGEINSVIIAEAKAVAERWVFVAKQLANGKHVEEPEGDEDEWQAA